MIVKKVKIKDIGKVVTGTTPATKVQEYYGDEYNFIKPSYIEKNVRFFNTSEVKLSSLAKEDYEKTFVPPLSTCVVTIGSIGEKMCFTKEECLTNQQINTVIPSNEYDKMYVYYLLKYNLYKVKAANSGSSSGRENVSKSIFENIEVEVTDLFTQKKISSILSSYDDLIENNLKRVKLLEETAELIYKEWFINFQFPGADKNRIKDGIPCGWSKKPFDEVCNVRNGYAFKSSDYSNEGVILIRTRDFSESVYIDIKEKIKISNTIADKYEKYLLKEYDFLLIMVGASIGKYGIVLKKDIPSLQNQNMWAIYSGRDEEVPQTYIIEFMKEFVAKLMSYRTGAARDFFRKSHLEEREILIPDSDILFNFDLLVKPLYQQISALLSENEKLLEARDILLPKLINGEIEV